MQGLKVMEATPIITKRMAEAERELGDMGQSMRSPLWPWFHALAWSLLSSSSHSASASAIPLVMIGVTSRFVQILTKALIQVLS